jgi:hypothetical protein
VRSPRSWAAASASSSWEARRPPPTARRGSRKTSDIVYARDRENLARLVAALGSYNPYLRGAPPGLPFHFDERTLAAGLNFILTTSLGDIDLLGEIVGGGNFENLAAHTVNLDLFGLGVLCVDLPTLIAVKRAAGRPKDLEAIAELQALLREREEN